MSMRVFCYLLIFFILQLHAKLSNANFNSQAPQAANNEGLGASTITQVSKKVTQDVKTRKVLKHVNVNIEANDQKNGLEIESKETVRKRKNKQRLTRTVSLTADYSNPGHHPPRHN